MKKRNLMSTWLMAVLVFAVCLASFPQEKPVTSLWAEPSPIIDGVYDDWLADALNSNEKMSIDYAFMNDSEYLFVLFRFNDPKYLSSINATGMTIWINTEIKDKKKFGVKFVRKKVTPEQFITVLEKQQGPLTEQQKEQFLTRPHYYIYLNEFINKKGEPLSGLSGTYAEPALFRLVREKKTVVYEFALSLKAVFEIVKGVEFEPGIPISVGFEWGGMIKGMSQEMMKRKASWDDDAEGGLSTFYTDGGGRWDSHALRRATPSQRSFKKYSFWVVVDLASGQ